MTKMKKKKKEKPHKGKGNKERWKFRTKSVSALIAVLQTEMLLCLVPMTYMKQKLLPEATMPHNQGEKGSNSPK